MTTTIAAPIRHLARSVARPFLNRGGAGPSCGTLARSIQTQTRKEIRSRCGHAGSISIDATRYPAMTCRRWQSSSSSSSSSSAQPPSSEETSSSTAQRPLESEPLHPEEDPSYLLEAPKPGSTQKLAQVEPRLSLTFTCTADACGHRSTHEFSKRAYTKGIVLVQCPQCKNRHLIADHLGWFKESTEEGTLRTVEDLLRAKGETVRTGRVNFDGDIEYDGEPSKAGP